MPLLRRTLFVVLSLLALAASAARAQEALDDLLAADRALSSLGLVEAVRRAGAPKIALIYPGAPVVVGREAAFQLLDNQAALRTIGLRWVPLYGAVSADGKFGVTYGVTGIIDAEQTAAATQRFGKYISAWQRDAGGWRMVAHAQIGLLPPSYFVTPPGFRVPALSPIARTGPAADMARADSAFSAMAARDGAPAAFAFYAAPDGILFPSSGELVRGADGIRRLMAAGPQSAWAWRPVVAVASAGGDIGFTVGEASITPASGPAVYTKYLSLWRRDPDGRIRYIVDGGNVRPGPAIQ
jgi:ketosteroid isomerase-like protein